MTRALLLRSGVWWDVVQNVHFQKPVWQKGKLGCLLLKFESYGQRYCMTLAHLDLPGEKSALCGIESSPAPPQENRSEEK